MIKFPMENINHINIITGKHPYLRKYREKYVNPVKQAQNAFKRHFERFVHVICTIKDLF